MNSPIWQKYAEYIKLNNLKSSKRRDLIFEHIVNDADHFTIDDLYQKMLKIDPAIGIATVYRTIRMLLDCDILTEHSFGEKKGFYELKISKSPDHGHLICVQCSRIVEFEFKSLENYKHKIGKQYGFKIDYHKLEIFGTCPECQKI